MVEKNPGDLRRVDPEMATLIDREHDRSRSTLSLIASETLSIPAVREAVAGDLSDKYSEGYPGNRYHGGCDVVDEIENLAIRRARDLFGAEHANVQSHSGTSANLAVHAAFAQPGDPVMALKLAHGGHQTHGSRVNYSGRWFYPLGYGLRSDTETIDYDAIRDMALLHRPRILVAGASSYSRLIDYTVLRSIADEIDCVLWVDAAHIAGLVAAQVVPSPVSVADVVSGASHKVLRGPRGGFLLSRAEHAVAVDKAVFPFSQGGPALNVIAAKAVAFADAATTEFRRYARMSVDNCGALSAALAARGLRSVSGGSDTHLVVVDVTSLGITGAEAQRRLQGAGIVCDRATLPFDSRPPGEGSGIRVGTAVATARGLTPDHMDAIAGLMVTAAGALPGSQESGQVAGDVRDLLASVR